VTGVGTRCALAEFFAHCTEGRPRRLGHQATSLQRILAILRAGVRGPPPEPCGRLVDRQSGGVPSMAFRASTVLPT
jgi:hypothetical protein